MGMDSCSWREGRPSAEGYDTLILDLYFGPPSKEGYRMITRDDAHFYELGNEVAKSIRAGGVTIALLGPVAVTTRDLSASYAKDLLDRKRTFSYESKYLGHLETSYEWLDHGFLHETKIDSMFAKVTEGITPTSPMPEIRDYVNRWANEYWVTINGIQFFGRSTTEGTITHAVAQQDRCDGRSVAQYAAKVLAIGKHTKLPVAAAMQYMNWDGILVLLPPCELREKLQPATNEEITGLLNTLERLAKGVQEDFALYGLTEHEDWVYEYRAPQAKAIALDIAKLEQKEKELAEELTAFDQMLFLIDGTGKPLVDAVATLFDKPGGGLKIEPTEKGAPLDLFVHNSKGRTLAIEVTGIGHALKKDDLHWADFLQYMPQHNARNKLGRVERIVLVVNTECKTKLGDRNRLNDISDPVKKTVTDNHICVIRSYDLYKLWSKTLAGMPVQQVFDMLFECDGVFEL
jgi:hypothetical protein